MIIRKKWGQTMSAKYHDWAVKKKQEICVRNES